MRLKIDLKGRTNPLTFCHVTDITRRILDNELCFRIEHNTITSDNETLPLHDIVICSDIERVSVCSDYYDEDDLRNLFTIITEVDCIYQYDGKEDE